MTTFGERLAQLRKERGVTQKQIAELLGVAHRTAQHYEYMEREPSIEQLTKLADFFNVSVDFLIGRTDNPKRC